MTKRKVAISVSGEVLREIERLRRQTGESRSAVCERALSALLELRDEVERRRRYVGGYRVAPESRQEIEAALATGLAALAAEPWDEAG